MTIKSNITKASHDRLLIEAFTDDSCSISLFMKNPNLTHEPPVGDTFYDMANSPQEAYHIICDWCGRQIWRNF